MKKLLRISILLFCLVAQGADAPAAQSVDTSAVEAAARVAEELFSQSKSACKLALSRKDRLPLISHEFGMAALRAEFSAQKLAHAHPEDRANSLRAWIFQLTRAKSDRISQVWRTTRPFFPRVFGFALLGLQDARPVLEAILLNPSEHLLGTEAEIILFQLPKLALVLPEYEAILLSYLASVGKPRHLAQWLLIEGAAQTGILSESARSYLHENSIVRQAWNDVAVLKNLIKDPMASLLFGSEVIESITASRLVGMRATAFMASEPARAIFKADGTEGMCRLWELLVAAIRKREEFESKRINGKDSTVFYVGHSHLLALGRDGRVWRAEYKRGATRLDQYPNRTEVPPLGMSDVFSARHTVGNDGPRPAFILLK